MGLKAVPPVTSKTSLPQTWHIPQRTEGLSPKVVHSLKISKVKPKPKPVKRQRVAEGVLPNIYCPIPLPIPSDSFSDSLISNLNSIGSDAQILKLLPQTSDIMLCNSKFGPVPHGSLLSYQQSHSTKTTDIINILSQPTYPPFPLPQQPSCYHTVLCQSHYDMLIGLHVNDTLSLEIEMQTRQQSQNKVWHDVRKNRLTSSQFKYIYSRKGDHASLASTLLKGKTVQTAAMRYGIKHEPEAANFYADLTGYNLYACGFVINPSSPHLGTSPDRKVYSHDSPQQFGLLEIKCPNKDFFADCKYLVKMINGKYKLKHTHEYFFQVMGQMALTGIHWCDFLVKCRQDYHLERIHFDQDLWLEIKSSLDKFFFDFYLPAICKHSV